MKSDRRTFLKTTGIVAGAADGRRGQDGIDAGGGATGAAGRPRP